MKKRGRREIEVGVREERGGGGVREKGRERRKDEKREMGEMREG